MRQFVERDCVLYNVTDTFELTIARQDYLHESYKHLFKP